MRKKPTYLYNHVLKEWAPDVKGDQRICQNPQQHLSKIRIRVTAVRRIRRPSR
jgi:hypothetical protein